MRRRLAGLAVVLTALFAGAWANREYLVLSALGARTEKRTLAEQQALIAPYTQEFAPASGEPPFPAVVQFHGCAGYRADFMQQWAKIATDAGFLVLTVDSNRARGLDRDDSLASVCSGKKLIGQERAGDVAAALSLAAARTEVDPGRIVAAGWSHGAWSLMDYIALAGAAPPSLSQKANWVDPAGLILFYPYCGEGSWSRFRRWRTRAEIIAFIAGRDTIVDGGECRKVLEKIARQGATADLIYYPDADHAFDDAGLLGGDYAHFFGESEASDAAARYRAFLDKIKERR